MDASTARSSATEPLQTSYSYEELLKCAKKELYEPGFPQLPAPPMLMFDRVTHVGGEDGAHGNGSIIAELDIKPDLWFFPCHFVEDPVMPACLGLDALWQLTGFFLGWSGGRGQGRALGSGESKFSSMILPTAKKVTYTVDMKRVILRKLIMGVSDGKVEVDGNLAFEVKDLKVGLFKPEA